MSYRESATPTSKSTDSTRKISRSTDLPLLPALNIALLSLGAAIHANPALLRPLLHTVHTLAAAL